MQNVLLFSEVEAFLRTLSPRLLAGALCRLELLQHEGRGSALIGAGLYTVRARGTRKPQFLYVVVADSMVVTNGFVGHAGRPPLAEMFMARWRQREVGQGVSKQRPMSYSVNDITHRDLASMKTFTEFGREMLENASLRRVYNALSARLALGDEITAVRRAQRLTQAELAQRAGLTQVKIAELECGEGNPSFETTSRVAAALDMHITLAQTKHCGIL